MDHEQLKREARLRDEREPLLREDPRAAMYPIRFRKLHDLAKTHEGMIWHANELSFVKDLRDWNSQLTTAQQHFLKRVLAFFATSDVLVGGNLATRFQQEVKTHEACFFYSVQAFMEQIHSETYLAMLETYCPSECEQLIEDAASNSALGRKADWCRCWMASDLSFAERLVAFAIVEGLLFSASFAAIYYFQEQGKMLELGRANHFIARDEGLHYQFALELYRNHVVCKLDARGFRAILSSAVAVEEYFVREALPFALLGMNGDLMIEYVHFIANRICADFEQAPIFPPMANPLPFMDSIALSNKSNFFETRPTEYTTRDADEAMSDWAADL
jgi:ribonucleotide reductase beta subunit family protein with ferritin-like domain